MSAAASVHRRGGLNRDVSVAATAWQHVRWRATSALYRSSEYPLLRFRPRCTGHNDASSCLSSQSGRLAKAALSSAHPTAARMHLESPCPCGTSDPSPGREHHYWDCPVAQAVIESFETALAPCPGFQMSHLWVPCAPHGVHGGVWQLVCLAAVAAMDAGRKRLYAISLTPHAYPPDLTAACGRYAAAKFWRLLADFTASSPSIPRCWQRWGPVPADHPLPYFDPVEQRLAVSRPAVPPGTPR